MGASDSKVVKQGDWEHHLCWSDKSQNDLCRPSTSVSSSLRSSTSSSVSQKKTESTPTTPTSTSFERNVPHRRSSTSSSLQKYTGIVLRGPTDRIKGVSHPWRPLKATEAPDNLIEMSELSLNTTTSTLDTV